MGWSLKHCVDLIVTGSIVNIKILIIVALMKTSNSVMKKIHHHHRNAHISTLHKLVCHNIFGKC